MEKGTPEGAMQTCVCDRVHDEGRKTVQARQPFAVDARSCGCPRRRRHIRVPEQIGSLSDDGAVTQTSCPLYRRIRVANVRQGSSVGKLEACDTADRMSALHLALQRLAKGPGMRELPVDCVAVPRLISLHGSGFENLISWAVFHVMSRRAVGNG